MRVIRRGFVEEETGAARVQKAGTAMRRFGLAAFCGFITTIWVANWLIAHVGVVAVGFGLMAPAGVFVAGVAFTLRDIVQRTLGREAAALAIVIGASASYVIAPQFALASGVAFLVSELADFAVYTPLERRSWLGAVLLSNTVGLLVDSWLFLTLAFGSLEFFWGQVLGKGYMTLAAILLLAVGRRAFLARHSSPELA
jgi:uncharacterized PurR-regulated membrane protein YhhQ (DUF165 family)